jgi:hypothetical protein
MDDDRVAFREAWKYRAAVRRFQSAFEAAEGLAESERQLLLKQLADWILQHLPNSPSEELKAAAVMEIEAKQAITPSVSGRDGDP